ncbi:centriolar and ciliogenesis-associated protein HYLS1 isoform 1-T1 [Cariama cristata]
MKEMMGPDGYRWAAPDGEEQEVTVPAPSQLYAQQGGSKEQARPRNDPYAEASFVLGVQPGLPTFFENGRRTRRLIMKRKVLRHRPDGGVEVSDESMSSDPGNDVAVWSLRQKTLPLQASQEDSISEGEIETSRSSLNESPSCWPHGDSPPFLLKDFGSWSSSASRSVAPARQPTSFIVPWLGHNQGKIDRVARYLAYKKEWEKLQIPGEDQRLKLRWSTRKRMLCKPELPNKPQHLYVSNTYVVPTKKK